MVPLIHLDFELRRDYIAKVLCINRDKPMTICGGKCFLKDQLERTAQRQSHEAESVMQEIEFNFFNQEIGQMAFGLLFPAIETDFSGLTSMEFSSTFIGEIFKPPRLS